MVMKNVIEKIGIYADIDTRRALGLPPKKLVIPKLNLEFPELELESEFQTYIEIPLVTKWTKSNFRSQPDIYMAHRICDDGKTAFVMDTVVWDDEDDRPDGCMYYRYWYDDNKLVQGYM